MGRGQQLARRLASQNVPAASGGEPIGGVGLAAGELLDFQRAGIAFHVSLQIPFQRIDIEAVPLGYRHDGCAVLHAHDADPLNELTLAFPDVDVRHTVSDDAFYTGLPSGTTAPLLQWLRCRAVTI